MYIKDDTFEYTFQSVFNHFSSKLHCHFDYTFDKNATFWKTNSNQAKAKTDENKLTAKLLTLLSAWIITWGRNNTKSLRDFSIRDPESWLRDKGELLERTLSPRPITQYLMVLIDNRLA